jgi:hypothetical protein
MNITISRLSTGLRKLAGVFLWKIYTFDYEIITVRILLPKPNGSNLTAQILLPKPNGSNLTALSLLPYPYCPNLAGSFDTNKMLIQCLQDDIYGMA